MIIRFICNGDYKLIWKNCLEVNLVIFRFWVCFLLGFNFIFLYVFSVLCYYVKFEYIYFLLVGCRCGWFFESECVVK